MFQVDVSANQPGTQPLVGLRKAFETLGDFPSPDCIIALTALPIHLKQSGEPIWWAQIQHQPRGSVWKHQKIMPTPIIMPCWVFNLKTTLRAFNKTPCLGSRPALIC